MLEYHLDNYHLSLSDREVCHSISKPISDGEDTLKSFMTFDTTPHRPIFKVVVGSQIMAPPQQSFPHNNTPVTRTYDLGSDTIYRIVNYVILPQNQLVMRKTHSNFLWLSISYNADLFLKWL